MYGPKLSFEEEVRQFYFWKESMGEIPRILLKVNGKKTETVGKFQFHETAMFINFFLLPAKKKLIFETADRFEIGDQVDLILYFEGQAPDERFYFHPVHSPLKYKLKINRVTTAPLGVYGGGFYQYQAGTLFDDLTIEVEINKNENIKNIFEKIDYFIQYEGNNYEVQSTGDKDGKTKQYTVRKVLRDLAEYHYFKNGKTTKGKEGFGILELRDGTVKLQQADNTRMLYITPSTVASKPVYKLSSDDFVQASYWDDGNNPKFKNIPKGSSIPANAISQDENYYKLFMGNSNRMKRHEERFAKGVGRVVRAFNMFVPSTEIGDYLKFRTKIYDKRSSFNMATNFISLPVGSVAKVYLDEHCQWGGNVVGKKIDFIMGENNISYNLVFDVVRNHEYSKEVSVEGQQYDTGMVWPDV